MTDMGIFRTTIEVASPERPGLRRRVESVMVASGSEYTGLPRDLLDALGIQPERVDRFETADPRVLERPVGFARIHAAGRTTATAVAFAEPGDVALLGAHALEGLNVRVDLGRRKLVPAGPMPAAAA